MYIDDLYYDFVSEYAGRTAEVPGDGFEGSVPDMIQVIDIHMPGGTDDNHEEPQLRQPVSRPKFEPGTSRI